MQRFPGDRGGRLKDPNSVTSLALKSGINRWTVFARLRKGIPLDKALAEPVFQRRVIPCSSFVSKDAVRKRLQRGWPLDTALRMPKGYNYKLRRI